MLDAASLCLLLIVLLPARWLRNAFAGRARWRYPLAPLGIACIASAIIGGGARPNVPLLLLGVLFLLVGAFVEFVWRWNARPQAIGTALAWGFLALVWTAPTAIMVSPIAEGKAAFWLVDVFDKLFYGLLIPALDAVGLGSGARPALRFFSEPLVFLSNNFVGMTFAGNLLFAGAFYEIVRSKARGLEPRLSCVEGRVPKPFALLWPIAFAYELWFGENPGFAFFQQLGLAVCGFSGAWTIYLLSNGSRMLRAIYWPMTILTVLHPVLFWIPCAIGFLNAFLPITHFMQRFTAAHERVAARIELVLIQVRALAHPVPVLLSLALLNVPRLYFLDDRWTGGLAEPKPSSTELVASLGDMVRIAWDAGAYHIDRYEFPNRAGSLPTTGFTPVQAELACRSQHKHLCTRDEWRWACSDRGANHYIFPDTTEDAAVNQLVESCSTAGRLGLVPSGSMPGCVNPLGVHDLPGNAFEWVAMPGRPSVYGLAGGYYEYNDDLSMSCPFAVVVDESQIPILDLKAIGFRCCT